MIPIASRVEAPADPEKGTMIMLEDIPATCARLTRRELIRRLAGGAGGVFCAGIGALGPPEKRACNRDHLGKPQSDVAIAPWKPLFLTSHQSETLALLAERIVPNSSNCQVDRIIDLLLSVDTAENQKRFTNSLSAMDRESTKRFGKPFQAISEAQQNALLTTASTEAAGGTENARTGSRQNTSSSAQKEPSLREHFENLKGWIAEVYYSTEDGMRELGWTGEYFFDRYVGCEHPEGHS